MILLLVRFEFEGKKYEGIMADESITCGGLSYELDDIRILPPAAPTKIVCIGLNYTDHAEELGMKIPDEPIIFLKPPSSLIGHNSSILVPRENGRVDYEAELAVIIGTRCKNVSASSAADVIMGYSCFNDVTERTLQKKDGQWTRAKSFDTFAPLGPGTVSDIDTSNLRITSRVNAELKQDSSTSKMIFSVGELVEFISSIMTLEKGDVISTGTPAGVEQLKRGDIVEVEIEDVGILRNTVKCQPNAAL